MAIKSGRFERSPFECTEIRNKERKYTMSYVHPQITGTYRAVSAIQSQKGEGHVESNPIFLTNGPAYNSNE
jgi:uncharacterized protein (DUF2141 family)